MLHFHIKRVVSQVLLLLFHLNFTHLDSLIRKLPQIRCETPHRMGNRLK